MRTTTFKNDFKKTLFSICLLLFMNPFTGNTQSHAPNWEFESQVHQINPILYGINAESFRSTFYAIDSSSVPAIQYKFDTLQQVKIDLTSLKSTLDGYFRSLNLSIPNDYQKGFRIIYGLNINTSPNICSIEYYINPVIIKKQFSAGSIQNLLIEPSLDHRLVTSFSDNPDNQLYKINKNDGSLQQISSESDKTTFKKSISNYDKMIYIKNYLNNKIPYDPVDSTDINKNGAVSVFYPINVVEEMCGADGAKEFYATSVLIQHEGVAKHSVELCTMSLDELTNKDFNIVAMWPRSTPANFSQLCPTKCNQLKAQFKRINNGIGIYEIIK